MSAREIASAAAIVVAALCLRLVLVFSIPAFQAPDERAHLGFVEHLAQERSLPVQPHLDVDEAIRFWPQSYQPPLAYLLFLPTFAAATVAGADEQGRLHALRCHNALYGALTVLAAFLVVARLTPSGDPRRLLAAGVAALLPGLAGNAAALNNDALANLLATLLWLPLLAVRTAPGDGARRGAGARPIFAAGVLFGLACATKLTVLPLAPLLLLVPWLRGARFSDAVRPAITAGLIAGVVLSPVLVRNALVYGDPLAIGAGSFSFGRLAAELPAATVAEMVQPEPLRALLEVIGRFGIYLQLGWRPLYVLWPLLCLAALVGWLRPRVPGRRDDLGRLVPVFAASLALGIAGMVFFSLRYLGGWQGRYVYPSLVPLAALVAGGLGRLLPDRAAGTWVAVLLGLLLALDVALVAALGRFYAETPVLKWGFAGWL